MIERVAEYLGQRNYLGDIYEYFNDELNEFFVEHGIGWKLVDGRVEVRGPVSFEVVLRSAKKAELQAGHLTASKELHTAYAGRRS